MRRAGGRSLPTLSSEKPYNTPRRRKPNTTAPETNNATAGRASQPPPPVLGNARDAAGLGAALAVGLPPALDMPLALAVGVALAPPPPPTVTVPFMKGCIVQW